MNLHSWLEGSGALGRWVAAFLTVATLVTGFYVAEKGRGSLALSRKIKELEKQGISLDMQQLAPNQVSAEKNFARSELLQPLYEFTSAQTNQNPEKYAKFEKLFASFSTEAEKRGYRGGPGSGSWRNGTWPNPIEMLGDPKRGAVPKLTRTLSPPSEPLEKEVSPPELTPDQAVQMLLDIFQQTTGPLLDELQQEAKKRPECSFDISYDVEAPYNILLPHLAKLKALEQQTSARAMARLMVKSSQPAFEDARFGLFLSDCMKEEPFLISVLVRIAMREIAITPIWYGLATRQWNADQLKQFQNGLESIDMEGEMRQALKAELILGNRCIETFRRKFPKEMNFGNFGDAGLSQEYVFSLFNVEDLLNYAYPKGWLYFEQVNYLDLYKKHILDPSKASLEDFVRSSSVPELQCEIMGTPMARLLRHTMLAGMLLPALEKAMSKAAYSQTSHNLAAIACALERYRLEKGNYPEALGDLIPQYKEQVPKDLFSGQPLIYQRKADGTFVLYSVGQNQTDEGGIIAIGKSGVVRRDDGDWVWQYPGQE